MGRRSSLVVDGRCSQDIYIENGVTREGSEGEMMKGGGNRVVEWI